MAERAVHWAWYNQFWNGSSLISFFLSQSRYFRQGVNLAYTFSLIERNFNPLEAAVMCTAMLNRFEGDQVNTPKGRFQHFSSLMNEFQMKSWNTSTTFLKSQLLMWNAAWLRTSSIEKSNDPFHSPKNNMPSLTRCAESVGLFSVCFEWLCADGLSQTRSFSVLNARILRDNRNSSKCIQ